MSTTSHLRVRFWIETVTALLATALTVLTLAVPTWIEAVTGSDPDAGSGAAEWAMVGTLVAVATASLLLGAREWRRTTAVTAG